MSRRPGCLARQYGDQMSCAACGLTWDTNDPEPPDCRKVDRRTKLARAAIKFNDMPALVSPLPETLPPDIILAMERAWLVHGNMQAAYRVFLDWMGS